MRFPLIAVFALAFVIATTASDAYAQSGSRSAPAASAPRRAAPSVGSGSRSAPSSRGGGSGTRSPSTSVRPSAGAGVVSRTASNPYQFGTPTAAAAGIAASRAPRSAASSGIGGLPKLPSLGSPIGGIRSPLGGIRSPFNSRAQAPLIPLSTATPSQYIQRNGATFPTGHPTGRNFYSHYYPRLR